MVEGEKGLDKNLITKKIRKFVDNIDDNDFSWIVLKDIKWVKH